jgi:antirestriction protein ArdC
MEDKHMKAQQAKKLAETGIANLASALERGKSETLTAYLAAMARFHRYSVGNIMLILSQYPDATRVAGYNTWKQLNRYVRKGEKGIGIIAPMNVRRKENREDPEADEERILRFRVSHVFDVSQTEGEPLPEVPDITGDPAGNTQRIKTLIAHHGIRLVYVDQAEAAARLGSAQAASYGGSIVVRADLTPAVEFSVLVHELAHEMLHHTVDRKPVSKTVCETEAEAVAFVVSQAIGLETGTAGSDYIQLYAGDKNTLAGSLTCIQKTATTIIEAITPDRLELAA